MRIFLSLGSEMYMKGILKKDILSKKLRFGVEDSRASQLRLVGSYFPAIF